MYLKSSLLHFLSIGSTYMEDGVNINQELIYKSLIPDMKEDQVFDCEVLLRIKSDGPTIIVFVNDD